MEWQRLAMPLLKYNLWFERASKHRLSKMWGYNIATDPHKDPNNSTQAKSFSFETRIEKKPAAILE